MGAALILLLVGVGALAAGVLIGRYYVPDDRQLRRSARHSRSYVRALSHLIARDYDTAVNELRVVVEENVDDIEPYFALGAIFRSRGEHERAIRVHQALAMRERDRRKQRQRAMYELGLDFRAAGMPRRATRALEDVLLEDASHEGAVRVLAALYEEQARFNEAAGLWQRIGRKRGEDTGHREHHLLVAAAQTALGRDDLESAKQLLKAAQKLETSAHFLAAAAELAAARGNHSGARERIRQALALDAALVPHLLPALIEAEQGLDAQPAEHEAKARDDELDDDAPLTAAPPLEVHAAASATKLPAASAAQLPEASQTQLPAASAAQLPEAQPASAQAQLPVGGELASQELAAAPLLEASPAPSSPADLVAAAAAISLPPLAPKHAPLATSAVLARTGDAEPVLGQLRAAEAAAAPVVRRVRFVPGLDAELDEVIIERVLVVLDEVEAQTGPRLELTLIRAQLIPATDHLGQAALAALLLARFPESLAARVAAGRLASASGDAQAIRGALDGLVSDAGALAWTLRGRWQCGHCGNRPGAFSWRCGQCRRWGTLRMETGLEPPPVAPRERRAAPRTVRPESLLGASPDVPGATFDHGLTEAELASAGVRRSLLGRVGGWVSGKLRRDPS